ncbi:zinc finger protein 485-like isoform X2 [Rhinatrema bivittatum]|uniref:zinc finger protein 485-like isoform X2 n=1 Tax=Rhinatrema bivittatum TaxID=194408 RepID=UPI00112D3A70|nr:zinc finger protein 485-like isoform X2 [Rhinatrema bivittatum]
MKMPAGASAQVPVTFEDIAVYFSQEEWEDLEEWQKELYKDVMNENYEILISLGSRTITPDIISHIERGEEPCIREEPGSEERETEKISCSADVPQTKNSKSYIWELSENPAWNKMLSEGDSDETSSCCDWGGNYRTQSIIEKTQRNSSGDAAENLTMCEQSASNISQRGEEQRNQIKQRCFCDVCGVFLRDSATLRSHQRFHTEQKPSTWTENGKAFRQKRESQEQEKSQSEMPFKCSECGDVFTRKGALVQHERIHTRERLFSCTICHKIFQKKSLIRYQTCHTSRTAFSCSDCDKSFRQIQVKPIECNKHFFGEKTLITHIEKRTLSCSEYGKSFLQKKDPVSHQKINKGKKGFKYSQSDKNLISLFYLKKHKMNHTGEKPFTCADCDKNVSQKQSLTKHQTDSISTYFNSEFHGTRPPNFIGGQVMSETDVSLLFNVELDNSNYDALLPMVSTDASNMNSECVQRVTEEETKRKSEETIEQRKTRMKMQREKVAEKRLHETIEQKETRLQKVREQARKKRSQETVQQRDMRLQKNKERIAQKRSQETTEQRAIRLEKQKARNAKKRLQETSKQRGERLQKQRERYGKKREMRLQKGREWAENKGLQKTRNMNARRQNERAGKEGV